MKKTFFLFVLLLFAQVKILCQQGFTFNRISTDDGIGLASNVVYCVYQDTKGFIWVGTANGLQRFDGSKFMQFGSVKGKNNLMISNLTQIVPADSSSLWLSFPDRQEFGLFNTSTFKYTVVPVKASRSIAEFSSFKLWKDHYGEVFLSVFKYGMLHYDKKQKAFTDDNYFGFQKGWLPNPGHFEDTLTHKVWFPMAENGIAIYDQKTKQLYTQKNNPQKIALLNNKKTVPGTSEIFIDSKRRHWIFNWSEYGHVKQCFDSTGKELHDTTGLNYNPDYSEMRFLYETKQGLLWTYGTNALYNYDKNQNRFFYYEHGPGSETGIQFHFVNQITEDRDGSIWIATDNGLYFTSPGSGTFAVVDMLFNDKKSGTEFTDIIQLKSGQYWLSTWGKGITTLSRNMIKYDAGIYNGEPTKNSVKWVQYRQAWALYQHTDGKVWVGCQAGNFMVYDTLLKRTRFLTDTVFHGATIKYVTGDSKGNILMGTTRGLIAKYDGKKFTAMQHLASNITKILVDKEGLVWIAAEGNGLYCLSADATKILKHYSSTSADNRLFLNIGKDIEELNDSTIVFGAGAMNFINKRTGKVSWLTFDDGLPGNSILRMRKDADGYLWMITLNGLCRYNPGTKRITTYGRKDGITLSHLTTEADCFSSDGYVMFTGNNALIYFLPSVFSNKQPPDVVITDFKLLNNYLPVDSLLSKPRIQFSSIQNSFSIYFSALSYVQREKLTYYYRMSGVDKDWIKADRQNTINYSLLPPGKYTFSVYCENIDGTRSKNITEIEIYIKPPFWRTYWFMSILLLIITWGVYMVHRLRVNKLLAVEKLRNRVARDLHDDMGSTLSTINILSSMAKSRMLVDPIKTAEYIGKISDNSQRMMEAMDDIVWSIKPSNDTMQKIVARMREFATNVLEAREIELDFRVDEPVYEVRLNMEARRDFFLIFKEAVNNAAKYSRASMVTVQLGVHNNRLVFIVADDGIGFETENSDNGNGLGNMQKRTDAMQGRLQVISRPGKGTRVTVNVPCAI
jgi:ligand-binding sensor domain-containing protein/two-component sensor histidine kinase